VSALKFQGSDLILSLYIQPKASRDQVMGLHGTEIKLAITAPPVDGKANAHIQKLLAKLFQVSKSQVSINKGELSRHKQLLITAPFVMPVEFLDFLQKEEDAS
jgi:uncharacterized protein (TIGR00251 family)